MDLLQATLLGALLGIAIPFIVWRLNRDNARYEGAGKSTIVLHHGRFMKILGILGIPVAGFLVIAPYLSTTIPRTAFIVTLLPAVVSLYVFLDAFFVKHTADERGVVCGSPFRRSVRILWKDLTALEINGIMWWYVLRHRKGRPGRVYAIMRGFRRFAQLAVENADRSVFDDLAWDWLNKIAKGAHPLAPNLKGRHN